MKKGLLFSFALLLSWAVFAQQDTLVKTKYTRLSDILFSGTENHLKEDSLLDNHHNYQLSDFNGNLGLPSSEIVLAWRPATALGMRYFVPNYRQHFFSDEDVAFYTTKNPYTRAFALVGQRQEQIIRVVHTQNIKRFNYTLKFNRAKCNGFYKSQSSVEDNFAGTVNYQNKSSRYKMYAWLLYNKLRHQENGGVYSEIDFEEGFRDNKELLRTNLTGAKRINRTLQTGLYQFFVLNKRADSTKKSHSIFHSFHYDGDFYIYNDTNVNAGFYNNFIYNLQETYDSAHVSRFFNSAGYRFQQNKEQSFTFFAAANHEIVLLNQLSLDSVVQNIFASVGSSFGNAKKTLLQVKGDYVLSGSNAGDAKLKAGLIHNFNFLNSALAVDFYSEYRSADLFFKRYYGNNFTWQNDFNKINLNQVNAAFSVLKQRITLGAFSRITVGQIYFDSTAMPVQYKGTIVCNRLWLDAKLKFKKIHFNNVLNYQFTNNEEIVRLPSFVVQSQLYYEGKHFKNNLHLQAGLQVNWYSLFYSNAYMPATNSYYLQHQKQYGNYPFIDVFLNADIKPVRLFVKYEHINQGLSGTGFMLSPDYPMPDRAFKFGFTWLFWD